MDGPFGGAKSSSYSAHLAMARNPGPPVVMPRSGAFYSPIHLGPAAPVAGDRRVQAKRADPERPAVADRIGHFLDAEFTFLTSGAEEVVPRLRVIRAVRP